MIKSLVIIPSVRNPTVITLYVANAKKHNFDIDTLFFLVLIEDFSDKKSYQDELAKNGVQGLIMNQEDRDNFLKERSLEEFISLIPKRSHAETSFGLLYLWINKEYLYAFLIDDDTEPENSFDYFGDHIKNLNFYGEITEVSSDKKWVNVLFHSFPSYPLYPRGYPYSRMGEITRESSTTIGKGDVWISQGLWTNVPDLDGIRILMDGNTEGQSRTRLKVNDYKANFTVARGNYLTVCSMNLAIRREVVPFFYQYPMDDNEWRIGRFDDIWSGVVAKRVLDELGKAIITCFPLCKHNKAKRSTFKDVNTEAPGYESNEYFWQDVWKSNIDGDIFGMSRQIAGYLEKYGSTDFIKYCGSSFKEWTLLLKKLSPSE